MRVMTWRAVAAGIQRARPARLVSWRMKAPGAKRAPLLAAVCLMLVGCGSESGSGGKSGDTGGGRNGGSSSSDPGYEENFRIADQLCSEFPADQIAREYGVSPSASDSEIAEAYAEQSVVSELRAATVDGCLAGLSK